MADKALRYIPALDGIRGVAIIFVLAHHYGYVRFGWIGLQSFFVLSGFLITSILLTEKNRRVGEYLGRFYWRRLLRTFPAYFGFLLVCGILYLCITQPRGFLSELPSLATYWYNFTIVFPRHPLNRVFLHLWSMSVEEQFYLIWPFVVFALDRANLRRIIVAIIVAIPLLRVAFFAYYHLHGAADAYAASTFYLATPFQLDAFATGAAIVLFRLMEWKIQPRWVFIASGCVLLLGLVNLSIGQDPFDAVRRAGGFEARLLSGFSFGYPLFLLQNRQFLWGYSIVNVFAAVLIISASQQNNLQKFFENRFLWYLGRISYGIYIVHWPIQVLLRPILPRNPWSVAGGIFFVILFVTTVGIAHLSYFYFEKRFLMMKDYFGKRRVGLMAPSDRESLATPG